MFHLSHRTSTFWRLRSCAERDIKNQHEFGVDGHVFDRSLEILDIFLFVLRTLFPRNFVNSSRTIPNSVAIATNRSILQINLSNVGIRFFKLIYSSPTNTRHDRMSTYPFSCVWGVIPENRDST